MINVKALTKNFLFTFWDDDCRLHHFFLMLYVIYIWYRILCTSIAAPRANESPNFVLSLRLHSVSLIPVAKISHTSIHKITCKSLSRPHQGHRGSSGLWPPFRSFQDIPYALLTLISQLSSFCWRCAGSPLLVIDGAGNCLQCRHNRLQRRKLQHHAQHTVPCYNLRFQKRALIRG